MATKTADLAGRMRNIELVNAELANEPDLILVVVNTPPSSLKKGNGRLRLGIPESRLLESADTDPKFSRRIKSRLCVELYFGAYGYACQKRVREVEGLFEEGESVDTPHREDVYPDLGDLGQRDSDLFAHGFPRPLVERPKLEIVFGSEAIDRWFSERQMFEEQSQLYRALSWQVPTSPEKTKFLEAEIELSLGKIFEAGVSGLTNTVKRNRQLRLGKSGVDDRFDKIAATLASVGNTDRIDSAQGEIAEELAKLARLGIDQTEVWRRLGLFVTELFQRFYQAK